MTLADDIRRDREAGTDEALKSACVAMFRIENSGGAVSFDDWVSPSRQRWQRYEGEARQILDAVGFDALEAAYLSAVEENERLRAAADELAEAAQADFVSGFLTGDRIYAALAAYRKATGESE